MKSKLCFADKGRWCSALTEKKCDGCSFYQTREQLEEGRRKALKRLQIKFPSLYGNQTNYISKL